MTNHEPQPDGQIPDDSANGTSGTHQPDSAAAPPDAGREPRLIQGHLGTRLFSLAALVERVVQAFEQEHRPDSPLLRDATTRAAKLKLLRDTANYVIAVESLLIAAEDQADVIQRAYGELFTYGPLDALFSDPPITTITLEGINKVAVRYGHGDLMTLSPLFDDHEHLNRVISRLLKDAGAPAKPADPYIETGLRIDGRPVSVNLVFPPASVLLTADFRVHPPALPPLESLVESETARALLTAIAQSPHGVIVVGEAESGKTTLLAMLTRLAATAGPTGIVAVERAGELHLPDDATRLPVQWAIPADDWHDGQPGITFGEQIQAALAQTPPPGLVLLDEVRADEPQAVVPLLTTAQPLRQMWAFRGPADSKRLASALGMLARRGDATHSEALVRALYERLPFVIVVRRRKDRLQLHSISEWQFPPGADYPDYVELMAQGWEGIELTGKHPAHDLPSGEDFWKRG